MKVSWHWLRSYVDNLPDPESLEDILTMAGLEVEGTACRTLLTDGVVVGEVTTIEPHPHTDRLQLCHVTLGGDRALQVVCGAPNVTTNQRVVVATPGAHVRVRAKRYIVRETRIKGVVSEGMICAEDEIGLSEDHTEILVLPEDAPLGQPLEHYLQSLEIPVRDTIYEVAITPNRPDAACHIGVARDATACTGASLLYPNVQVPQRRSEAAVVHIECPEACPRYVAILVRDVSIGPSPLWLQQRLLATGHRPVNNVVDITSFVMLECGQPLHAFDYDRLNDAHIVVRQAEDGESFTTLDGKVRTVPEGTVLICDSSEPVALAGIMGGANSEVDTRTTNVLLESAYFDPAQIRRSARALGMSTEASYRFERGIDPCGQVRAAARAADLMRCNGVGTPERALIDHHVRPPKTLEVVLRLSRITRVLGAVILRDEVVRILSALGFVVVNDTGATLRLRVPHYRPDVTREIDIIEEVARIHGLDALQKPAGFQLAPFVPKKRTVDRLRTTTRSSLAGRGYREIYTNSLLSEAEAELYRCDSLGVAGGVVTTLNAASQTMTALRPNLLCGMLSVMGHNSRHGQEPLRFWEFGHVFQLADMHGAPVAGYAEHESLLLAAAGAVYPIGWDHNTRAADFFDVKGDLEALMQAVQVADFAIDPDAQQSAVTQFHVRILANDRPIGNLGRISNELADKHGIRDPVYFAELNWELLVQIVADPARPSRAPIYRYPFVRRDLAVVVNQEVPAGPMLECVLEAGMPLVQDATIFDLFGDQRLGIGNKGLAFSLRMAAERTLTDAEVDATVDNILKALHQRFGATLRNT